jgi:hypothetical protein
LGESGLGPETGGRNAVRIATLPGGRAIARDPTRVPGASAQASRRFDPIRSVVTYPGRPPRTTALLPEPEPVGARPSSSRRLVLVRSERQLYNDRGYRMCLIATATVPEPIRSRARTGRRRAYAPDAGVGPSGVSVAGPLQQRAPRRFRRLPSGVRGSVSRGALSISFGWVSRGPAMTAQSHSTGAGAASGLAAIAADHGPHGSRWP